MRITAVVYFGLKKSKIMPNKICLVATTINEGQFLDSYVNKIKEEMAVDKVTLIVIPDKKTPPLLYENCDKIKERGINIICPTLREQEFFLKKLGNIQKIIPYNSDNRRNIGFLLALKQGCDLVISIDDDNFPLKDKDFLKHHLIVGTKQKLPVVRTNSHWFNICDLLKKNPDQRIYPRGYPYSKRWQDISIIQEEKEVQIMLNEGLWVNDPDVDSITRINQDVKIIDFLGKQTVLDIGTWSPINTQNTAFQIDLLPAFYFFLMGEKVDNLIINRYGDIWAGLFIKKIMDSLGYYAAFGNPLVNHIRNKHDLFEDLKQELGCIIYTDLLVDILEDVNPKGRNPIDLSLDLSNQLLKYTLGDKRFSRDFKLYMKKLNYNQKVWLETIQKLKQ